MSNNLEKLYSCNNIFSLVKIFHYEFNMSAKEFWDIIYSKNHYSSYISKKIPKANGSERELLIPPKPVKDLQKKFAIILSDCLFEIRKKNPNYLVCNHAFEKKKSIITNAKLHRNKNYVLNIDLSDFFGSIHYGRIYSFFKKDTHFKLNDKIAKIIAQISCYRDPYNKTFLPQGSPLSPVIASLIGNLLDIQLIKIAKKYKLTYSRYADDLTFSSNMPIPKDLIYWNEHLSTWKTGYLLQQIVHNAGFKINEQKTRLFSSRQQQTVTGIVVNRNLNVNNIYQKNNRAMLHNLYTHGEFFIGKNQGTIDQLIGRLNHVVMVKYLEQHPSYTNEEWDKAKKELIKTCSQFDKKIESNRSIRLLRQAIFYKYFISLNKTIIFPEGFTDSMYFRLANKIRNKENKDNYIFQNLNTSLAFIGLGGGTNPIQTFLSGAYEKYMINTSKLKIKSNYPAIFILDYDEGLENFGKYIQLFKNDEQWKHIKENLYVVLLCPLKKNGKSFSYKNKTDMVCIENLLSSSAGVDIVIDSEDHNKIKFGKKQWSKVQFANLVANKSRLFDFKKFDKIFEILKEIEQHYKDKIVIK